MSDIWVKEPQDHKKKLQAPCYSNFQKGNDHMTWDETISVVTPLHCLAMTLLSNLQNLQKVENDIVIFNGNVLGHAWQSWYQWKKDELLFTYMHATCKYSDQFTLERWAFGYGLPFFLYALYSQDFMIY